MTPTVTLRKALTDPKLLGSVLAGETWRAWCVLLIAAMGEPLTDDERAIFTALTGRAREPLQRIEELIAVVGRRGGKSRAMATLATYIAGLCKHPLVRGERGVLLSIAPDQRQSSIVLGYTVAAFEASPILKQLIANRTADTLELTNGVSVEVRSASFRRLRGPTYIAVIADEAAFWYSDEFSANADSEILGAVRPGLATTSGPLIIASSPYAKRGVLFETHKRHFGAAGDPLILVAQGASRTFNPSLPQTVVDRAMERDPASATAEYLAQFRSDIETFIAREAVEACVSVGVRERAPLARIQYAGFIDPAGGGGGSGGDSMTLEIAHREGDMVIVDALRERKPSFSPTDVVSEFAALLKSYRISSIKGDRWGGEWCREPFREHQISYEANAKPKADLYRDMLPAINSRKVDLLDDARLVSQICNLERRTARGGKDLIDHAPGAHDDLANVVAGVIALVATPGYTLDFVLEPPGAKTNDDGLPKRSLFDHPYFSPSARDTRGSYRR